MKKRLSLILVVALILATIPSFAFAEEIKMLPQNDPLLEAFVEYGLAEVTVISENNTSKSALVTFDEGTVNNVIVNQEQDSTVYKISDGAITDTIKINCNGEVFLNDKAIGSTDTVITPQVINQPFQQNGCPYGSASDYSYQAGTEQKANIALEKAIKNYTAVALAALVVFYASPLLIAAIGGAGTAVASSLFGAWISNAQSASPDSKALSYKLTFYHHKNYTSGTVTPALMYIRKNVITYYTEANYKGTSYKHTSYSGTIL
jgi:hypothetical protein